MCAADDAAAVGLAPEQLSVPPYARAVAGNTSANAYRIFRCILQLTAEPSVRRPLAELPSPGSHE